MLPSRYFYDLTQPEIAGQLKNNPLVILPCGSVEQHGPHLPTGTDTLAANVISHAVAELVEVGVITVGTQPVFDIEGVLSQSSILGQLLRALFGYSSAPEAITFATWLLYIVIVLPRFLRPMPPPPAKAPVSAPAASAASSALYDMPASPWPRSRPNSGICA